MENRSVEELRAELRAAEKREEEERKAIRDSLKPIYVFEIFPAARDSWHEIWDETVKVYKLSGFCINREECAAIGKPTWDYESGSMVYLYNTITKRLICANGGGRVWFSTSGHGYGDKEKEAARAKAGEAVVNGLSIFLDTFPEGGDVTEIVSEYQKVVHG